MVAPSRAHVDQKSYPGPCVHVTGYVNGVNVAARSNHVGGVHVLFADAHCEFVSNDVVLETWSAYGTIDYGEVINAAN
jgi:prepilin-type processing-associated H-X9-DG protein